MIDYLQLEEERNEIEDRIDEISQKIRDIERQRDDFEFSLREIKSKNDFSDNHQLMLEAEKQVSRFNEIVESHNKLIEIQQQRLAINEETKVVLDSIMKNSGSDSVN